MRVGIRDEAAGGLSERAVVHRKLHPHALAERQSLLTLAESVRRSRRRQICPVPRPLSRRLVATRRHERLLQLIALVCRGGQAGLMLLLLLGPAPGWSVVIRRRRLA